jgi:hypothetical protein
MAKDFLPRLEHACEIIIIPNINNTSCYLNNITLYGWISIVLNHSDLGHSDCTPDATIAGSSAK